MPDFSLEASVSGHVAGVDEAGRGPLAGPVIAAAVVFLGAPPLLLSVLLDDSKRLSKRSRDQADHALRQATGEGLLIFALGAASVDEIGRLNILRASHLAMLRAVRRLPVRPALVLCDGNTCPDFGCPSLPIIGGDARSLSIAAASILAKVMRDKAMSRLEKRWPDWGFCTHRGYPTPAHRSRLALLGPTPHHRRGFSPVDQTVLRFG